MALRAAIERHDAAARAQVMANATAIEAARTLDQARREADAAAAARESARSEVVAALAAIPGGLAIDPATNPPLAYRADPDGRGYSVGPVPTIDDEPPAP